MVGMWKTVPGVLCATMGPDVRPPEVRVEAGWADEIPGGRRRALRMGEVEGTWHGLEPDGVVVHLHWREGHCVRSLVSSPPSGRLYSVEDLE